MSSSPPAQPTTSSSSTLWATPSKEWVIPAKPKPGRKPKKETAAAADAKEPAPEEDGKGKRGQNRAAQRAFRERKQSQLAELQARLQQYEQGDVERNIALQTISKRLKEENDKLRLENALLKERINKYEETRRDGDRKRKVGDSGVPASPASTASENHARKRARVAADLVLDTSSPSNAPTPAFLSMYSAPSPPSSMSSPATNISSLDSYPQLSFEQQAATSIPEFNPRVVSFENLFDFSTPFAGMTAEGVFGSTGCGFCNGDTPCVCREFGMQPVRAANPAGPGPKSALQIDGSGGAPRSQARPLKHELGMSEHQLRFDQLPTPVPAAPRSPSTSATAAHTPMPTPAPRSSPSSILDNLPAYQPPVPLRRTRSTAHSSPPRLSQLFPVVPSSAFAAGGDCPTGPGGATCSGDPGNCAACADDLFGQAFCTAVGESLAAAASEPCANCPSAGEGCCGNPDLCGGVGSSARARTSARGTGSASASTSSVAPSLGALRLGSGLAAPTPHSATRAPAPGAETVPCNAAWTQIKAHPHAAFADLSLLAEVVARRSKCTGPRIVDTPPPSSRRPSPSPEPAPLSPSMACAAVEGVHYSSTDLSERRTSSSSAAASTASTGVQIKCGRPSVRELPAEAVRDALRLLDLFYPRPPT